MTNLVLVEKKQGYAILTLNRPDAMNALSKALRDEFCDAFRQLQQDQNVAVVIVTGSGKAFCAGFDLKELGSGADDNAADSADNEMAQVMEDFDGPIIAAINGFAITGGFELALACDVLVASNAAKFADTHARVGILPGWGLSQRLPRLIGLSRARELSFTGNTIDAQQAYDWGLVNCVLPQEQLLAHAEQLAVDMGSCVQPILKQYKQLIDDGYSMPLVDALAFEAQKGIESAKAASAAMIAARREKVVDRGREQK